MDKNLVKKLKERSKGLCEVCYSPGTEIHHAVSGRGRRKQHEAIESIYLLCYDCHRGNKGVHGRDGRALDVKLKRRTQERYCNQGLSEDEIRKRMGGKIY